MTITLNGSEGITLDNGAADGAQVSLSSSGYSNWNLDNYSGRLRAYYGSTEYFTINSSGNVGIGTSSPSARLHVTSSASGSYGAVIYNTSATGQGLTVRGGSTSSQDAFNVQTYDGGTSLFTVQGGGNVGIGTSSPASYSGYTVVTLNNATNGGVIDFQQGGTRVGTVSVDNTIFTLGSIANTPTRFLTNGSERARIDTSGNLLVGCTSFPSVGTGGSPFGVGISSSASMEIIANGSSAINLRRDNSDGTLQSFRRGTTVVGAINVTSSATSYVTSSDYRLKENIAPMTGALSVVQQLKPVTYNWKVDGSDGQGFIAHELQAVVPDCVTGEKDAVDADGNPVYQGIDTSFLVATLTAAIQEQQAIIESLKTRIETLENK